MSSSSPSSTGGDGHQEGTRLQSAIAGGMAGLVARFVVAPLDVVKIRMQLHSRGRPSPPLKTTTPPPSPLPATVPATTTTPPSTPLPTTTTPYRSSASTARHVLATEGITAFWKGNVPAELLYLSYAAVQFSVYRSGSLLLGQYPLPETANHFVCGAASGAAATTSTYPLDLLRTRFAAQGSRRVYASLLSAVTDIARDEGWRGFFRGLGPTLGQIVPFMGFFFACYEGLKSVTAGWDVPAGPRDASCGTLAGVVAKTLVFPLDLVRKRIQVQGPTRDRYVVGSMPEYSQGARRALATILRKDGVRGLYRGLAISLAKAGPSSAVTMWTYGRAMGVLKGMDEKKGGE